MVDVIDRILEREGWPKFTDRPHDRGGPTKGGITLALFSGYLRRPASVDELKAINDDEARKIYQSVFIDDPGFSRLNDQRLRDYMVDTAVTSSAARATRYLQSVLGFSAQAIDGVCGSGTAAAANAIDAGPLLCHLIARRVVMIGSDVQDHPEQLVNLEGWLDRAVEPLIAVPFKQAVTPRT